MADRHAPRARLDLRQVDLAVGELSEHPHERARRAVVEAPEDHRRLGRRRGGACPPAPATRTASGCRGGPRCARPAPSRRTGRRPGAARSPPTARRTSATTRTSAGRRRRDDLRARQPRRDEARHCAVACGCDITRVTSLSAMPVAGDQRLVHRVVDLVDDPDVGRLVGRARRASRSPSPRSSSRSARPRGRPPGLHGHDRLEDRRVGISSAARRLGADARSASSANVPAGPRRRRASEVARPLSRFAERPVDRLLLLGRELDLRLALGASA